MDVGELVTAAQRLGFRGLNVTHPCKQEVVKYLDDLSPEAAELGAVNTVVFADGRSTGHNTDRYGFAESFRRGLPAAAPRRVVLIGAGGAGTAVAYALRDLGTGHLTIVDADADRAPEAGRVAGARQRRAQPRTTSVRFSWAPTGWSTRRRSGWNPRKGCRCRSGS